MAGVSDHSTGDKTHMDYTSNVLIHNSVFVLLMSSLEEMIDGRSKI